MKDERVDRLRQLRNRLAHGLIQVHDAEFAKQLEALGISVPQQQLEQFGHELLGAFSAGTGGHVVPRAFFQVAQELLAGRQIKTLCDPCAGSGLLVSAVGRAVGASTVLAFTERGRAPLYAQALSPELQWISGTLVECLGGLASPLDAVVSIPSFGGATARPLPLTLSDKSTLTIAGDQADQAVALTSARLSPNGLGLFVVTPRFFFARTTTMRVLAALGLHPAVALALPPSSFAPETTISTYLLVVRRGPSGEMYADQLPGDFQGISAAAADVRAYLRGEESALGYRVAPEDFRGIENLRLAQEFRETEAKSGLPSVTLDALASQITLGRPATPFTPAANAMYVPLVGTSDVLTSLDELSLKSQNYAQVVVNPHLSDARFVAQFLNSELGRLSREANKSGAVIQKLNTAGLRALRVLVPAREIQAKALTVTSTLEAQHNTLLGLSNELASLRRALWTRPAAVEEIASELDAFSARLSPVAATQAAKTLEQWGESLPFPLASILRAWQASPSRDYKTRYEHLLHFFEATAEFISIVLLSAFAANAALLNKHREKIAGAWQSQHLSVERATFGTWKVVVEYLGKQTRALLGGSADDRALCAELFADPSCALPQMLARTDIVGVLSSANTKRNDWSGHGPVVGADEARLRNEQLVTELERLRAIMEEGWDDVALLQCLHARPRQRSCDNEVALLTGSNGEFLKQTRTLSVPLMVDRLYLHSRECNRALALLPLVQMGPSPESARNACYFFNRVDREGLRFISYHYTEGPEQMDTSPDAAQLVAFLAHGDLPPA